MSKTTEKNAKTEKPTKPERVSFASTLQPDQLNADGRILNIEATESFEAATHLPLKKVDFQDEHVFLTWKAAECDRKAAQMTERAASLREQATNLQKYGDPAQRARVKKLQAMQKSMAELTAQLKAEGIEV